MFLGTSLELLRRWSSSGHFDWFFCEDATTSDGALYFWSYVYYLSKYYETRWCFQVFIYNPSFGASTEFSASCNRYIPGIKAVYTANWVIGCSLKPTARTKNKPMIATSTRKCWTLSWFFSRRAEFLTSSYKSIIMQLWFLWLGYGVRLSNHCNGVAYSSTHWCMWLCLLTGWWFQIFIYIFSPLFIIWGRCSSILTSIFFRVGEKPATIVGP